MTSNHENFLGSFGSFFDQGLLIIGDALSRSTHEGWDPASEFVHWDFDSLYVSVQSAVDGPVDVAVYRDAAPDESLKRLLVAFEGALTMGTGQLTFEDSAGNASMKVAVSPGSQHLSVFVDQLNWTRTVVVVLGHNVVLD